MSRRLRLLGVSAIVAGVAGAAIPATALAVPDCAWSITRPPNQYALRDRQTGDRIEVNLRLVIP